MAFHYTRDQLILFFGDLVVFIGSLWLALMLRHFVAPTPAEYLEHLGPFAFLFAVWLLVFVAVGLYDKHIALFERTLTSTVTEAQAINLLCAFVFFFLAPVAIQPKTVLVLYFVVSTALIVVWRLGLFHVITNQRVCEPVVIVGTGPDIAELVAEVRATPQARFVCAAYVDSAGLSEHELHERVHEALMSSNATTIVSGVAIDFPEVKDVLDATYLYEAIFERVPLTLITATAFTGHQSVLHAGYGVVKRGVDMILSLLLLVLLGILIPFVYLATRLNGPGPLFITQDRIGRGWVPMKIFKFRTMTFNEAASSAWVGESENRVTKVGAFLRRTSIDELPQVISVFTGELSLIGPRSDIMGLGERLQESLPFYRLRYLVTPGISGWAQVNQRYAPGNFSPQSIEESRVRLQYDLYYIRHRSLLLDLSIALKTLKTLSKRIIP